MFEFVAPAPAARQYHEDFVVRLSDANERGHLRLDGLARALQDVATDDWTDTGISSSDTWVVRRTALRFLDGATWPCYLDTMTLTTWCGGVGPAWAERRTDVVREGELVAQAEAIWVPTDQTGRPVRIGESFFRAYGDVVRERRVSGRVVAPEVTPEATSHPWALRASDIDLVGHVNNAAVWQAVGEVTPVPLRRVVVQHHGALEKGDEVTLLSAPGHVWLQVAGTVRVSVMYDAL